MDLRQAVFVLLILQGLASRTLYCLASQTCKDNDIRTAVLLNRETQTNLREMKLDMEQQLQNQGQELTQMQEQLNSLIDIADTVKDLKKEIETLKTAVVETTVNVTSSSIYTRWGRRSCPDDTELVYEGFAGGGDYHDYGASSNYICLPKDPIFVGEGSNTGYANYIYGAEYETNGTTILSTLNDHDVPCAVCRVAGRSIVMIPARNVCYSGWQKEYSGYLMSSYYGHLGNKELVCMDGSPEAAEGSDSRNQNGALFYIAEIKCGSLKCPPYLANEVITCVVCSK
ncbi:hypothetical protein MAR_032107 [Mya arenaria]|uniref:Short-chain collagen C4-like n=1 Tax=Mya arenaria TaxID=6604 RepID=A0ABY7F9Z5_MYAAR|nr:uncharacterized protein LOC128206178 [Mya arenaria]WAR17513.1 hypothetical protein MAR_032107 [Mya arenaria]